MRTVIEAKPLVDSLRMLRKIVKNSATKSALRCVRMELYAGVLTVDGTDLEVAMEFSIQADNANPDDSPYEFLVNIDSIWNACAKAKGKITMSQGEAGEIIVETGGMVSSVETQKELLDQFPARADWGAANPIATLAAEDLRAGLKRSVFAIAKGDSRYALCGLFVRASKGNLELVASDTHRLSVITYKGAAIGEDDALIVGANILTDVLKGQDGVIRIGSVSKKDITIQGQGVRFMARRIEGQFPEYKKVIPKYGDDCTRIEIKDRKALIESLRAIRPLVNAERNEIDILATPGGLLLQAEKGKAETKSSAATKRDPITLNVQYLIEALDACDMPMLDIQYQGGESPIKIVSAAGAWKWIHLTMPLRPYGGAKKTEPEAEQESPAKVEACSGCGAELPEGCSEDNCAKCQEEKAAAVARIEQQPAQETPDAPANPEPAPEIQAAPQAPQEVPEASPKAPLPPEEVARRRAIALKAVATRKARQAAASAA